MKYKKREQRMSASEWERQKSSKNIKITFVAAALLVELLSNIIQVGLE